MSLAHEDLVVRIPQPAAARGPAVAASRLKRAFDIALSVAALIFLAPFLALVAAAIRLDSPGPALFRQTRSGLGGAPFLIFKFRTMRCDQAVPDLRQATRGDARITRLGRLLRAFSIDELPQLLNVARGDMSIVGPRPHALAHDRAWAPTTPGYDRRFRARPGLTGRAQVLGFRGEIMKPDDLRGRIEADNRYIDEWSFRQDLFLVLATLPKLLKDPAAY